MANERMDDAVYRVAKASYERCCEHSDFFSAFYDHLFEAKPHLESMFKDTDFERQHRLQQHAIGLLLDFGTVPLEEPNILTRLADRHGKADLNVDPALYLDWVDCLVKTVQEHDAEWSPEIGEAWRRAVEPGVEYMKARFDA